MLDAPDSIAVVGLCGVLISAIIKFIPSNSKGNGGVKKEVCDERHKSLDIRLASIEGKLDDLNTYLRGK